MNDNLLEIQGLRKYFPLKKGFFGGTQGKVRAVDGISFSIPRGRTFGLVGESGSGKTTVARAILRLIEPSEGRILWQGKDICRVLGSEMKEIRRNMQMIFQDPHSSLNPRKTVFQSVAEPLVIHERLKGKKLREQVEELLALVGLKREHMFRYPHELSGGQKQRVGISRALSLHPRLLILDEPTSALDVSVQAQMLNFLESLQEKLSLTYLYISHNLAVIRYACDRVGVMYLGRILEAGNTEEVFSAPRHPYTRALVSAVPLPQAEQPAKAILLEGDIPSATHIPSGCRFHTRCPERIGPICAETEPSIRFFPDGSQVTCHLYG
ncbi:MAG: ABC transporter ATP-binding protein [Syntrophaceae bacterium]|nr:ABC transporter ATP-binding protein [Syntrophaceae bacterium]